MNDLERGLRRLMGTAEPPAPRNAVTVDTLRAAGLGAGGGYLASDEHTAMRLSAVDRCVEAISDSIGKLPIYVMDLHTRERVEHPIAQLLSLRPNDIQTPFAAMKFLEGNRLCGGNGCAIIERDPASLRPAQLVPVPWRSVSPWLDTAGRLRYNVTHPFTGRTLQLGRMDVLHVMGYSYNGYDGVSVLSRAAAVIGAGRAAQDYQLGYYANGGQPSGVLQADGDLGGSVEVANADGTTRQVSKKDLIRAEWDKRHSGPANAQRIAVLDLGLKYEPISINNKDMQFVEQSELSVQDIARFFGVPLYKLQSGKQSYSSNEQNAIEYVVSTLHPIVSQYEDELTYKLLTPGEVTRGLRIRMNLMAELRGDVKSRGEWYRAMREIGAYSVNDIRALEDETDVDGGDERYASLNFVPLADFRELSHARNVRNGGGQ